jgi:hypothetical protein
MKENKKLINIVSKLVTRGVQEVEILKIKGKEIAVQAKKEWEEGEPARKLAQKEAEKTLKKLEKRGGRLVRASIQIKKDITKGIKRGLKNSKKKST